MKAGEKIGHYTILTLIGQGAFGRVYFAHSDKEKNKYVAIKQVSLIGESGNRERQAIEAYKKCPDCDSLLKIYQDMVDETCDYFYYVMELADNLYGEDHQDYVPATLAAVLKKEGKLSVAQTAELISQLLEGLSVIHENNLVHRDIKPANIIFVNKRAKLSDIGLMANHLSQTYKAGSEGFLPPRDSCIPENSTTVDLYALTRLIYCCLSGKHPGKNIDLDWSEVSEINSETGSCLLKLMFLSEEDLMKMSAADFLKMLNDASFREDLALLKTMSPTMLCSSIPSLKSEELTTSYQTDSLAALPALAQLASADAWIHKQKLNPKDFLKIAAIATGATAAVLGIPLVLLAGGGILLSKYLKK